MKRTIKVYDPALFILALVATVLGLVFIFDAGYARALESEKSAIPHEFVSQLIFLVVAFFVSIAVSRVKIESWKKWSKLLWLLNLILLVAVMVVGHRLNGARRWLGTGNLSIQPAEFAKVAAILYLAGYFAERKSWPAKMKRQKNFALTFDNIWWPKLKRCLPAIWVAAAVFLIEIEPDMGTGAVIAATAFAMFLPGGVTRKSIAWAMVIAVIVGGFFVYKEPYRLQRFIDHPSRWTAQNIDDTEYQTVQAELSESSGGILGQGLGGGRGKHVLPATTTDFIMATIGEEGGLVGALFVLALLGGIVWRLLYLAGKAQDRFSMLVLYGVGYWLGIQTCVNVMMANAFLPAIGIPLPLISSGGSSLVAIWIALGVCQAAVAPKPKPVEEPEVKVRRDRVPTAKVNWHRRLPNPPYSNNPVRPRMER